MRERFPLSPYPIGWFRVGGSADLAPGEVKPLRYFGRDLVLFRGKSGEIRVLDATCPHLGAHLGIGGTVDGDCVVCPFHGWRYNGEGRCVHAPLAARTPVASTRSWPVRELMGQIMIWHHPDRTAPTWELPAMVEHGHPEWRPFEAAQHWVLHTHCQELPENAMDIAHFPWIHHQNTAAMATEGFEVDGPILYHRTSQRYNLFGLLKMMSGDVTGPLDVTLLGLGVVVNRAAVKTKLSFEYCYPFFITPIDDEHIDVHSFLAVKKTAIPGLDRALALKAKAEGRVTIEQDIPIWENKVFQVKPRLSSADGPIMGFRKWSRQFYPDGGAAVYGAGDGEAATA